MLTCGWPVQGGWNSGRKVTISSTGKLLTALAGEVEQLARGRVNPMRVLETMTTGCRHAKPSSWRISPSSVLSFFRCGLRFSSG